MLLYNTSCHHHAALGLDNVFQTVMGFPCMVAAKWWGKTAVRGCRCKFFKSDTRVKLILLHVQPQTDFLQLAGGARRWRCGSMHPAARAALLAALRRRRRRCRPRGQRAPRSRASPSTGRGSRSTPRCLQVSLLGFRSLKAWLTAGWQGQSCMKSAQSSSIEPGWHSHEGVRLQFALHSGTESQRQGPPDPDFWRAHTSSGAWFVCGSLRCCAACGIGGSQSQRLPNASAGLVFKAGIRFNATDRSQAFASVDGVTSDILIKVCECCCFSTHAMCQLHSTVSDVLALTGLQLMRRIVLSAMWRLKDCWRMLCPGHTCRAPCSAVSPQGPAQNRAVDGDEVALQILPPSQWHHMRGGVLPSGDLLAVPASDPPSHFRSPGHSGWVLCRVLGMMFPSLAQCSRAP